MVGLTTAREVGAIFLIKLRGSEIRIIGTVHDEIILEAPSRKASEAAQILTIPRVS